MRIVAEYTREERVKYISHLDLMRVIQRSMRRASIPVAFSQGFNPHPKLAFASALPVGVTSSAEYMDTVLSEEMEIDKFINRFNTGLPKGISITAAVVVDDHTPSLMSLIEKADYQVILGLPERDFDDGIRAFLGQPEIRVEKQGKKGTTTVDIREGIFSFEPMGKSEYCLALRSGSQGNVKPETVMNEFLRYMGVDHADIPISIHRTGLFIQKNGCWVTPLALRRE